MKSTWLKGSAIGVAVGAISLFALAGAAQGAIVKAEAPELTTAIVDPTATPVGASSFPVFGTADCADGEDDDTNGFTDFSGGDPGCSSAADNDESPGLSSNGVPECQDGEDQGADGDIDFPDDPECASATDADEDTAGEQDAECETALDDDGDADGGTFPADPQCVAANDDDEEFAEECGNGVDDDGDGQIDDPDGCVFPYDDDESPPDSPVQPAAVADSSSALAGFPIDGPSYGILSSGDATGVAAGAIPGADNNGGDNLGHGAEVFDLVTHKVDLQVPAAANCVRVDFRFLTGELVADLYDDGFIAELDTSDFTVDPTSEAIAAPNNFATDGAGNFVTVHTTALDDANAAGTEFERGTPLLTASRAITPGAHSVLFSVYDEDDSGVASAVFLDNLALGTTAAARGGAGPNCAPGDFVAPDTEIDKKPKKKTTKKKVKLRFSSNEAGASFECKLDKGRFKRCDSPKKVKAKKQGKHKFKVRAVDEAGNVDKSPAKAKWKKKPKR